MGRFEELQEQQAALNEAVVAGLLKPISQQSPAGRALGYTVWYDQIRAARHEEEDFLPQGVWVHTGKKADWPQVQQLCSEALSRESKDLQIAWWLTESWSHLYGVMGLLRGLELIEGLVRDFWADLHPKLTEDLDYRMMPFFWANTKLAQRLLMIMPLTYPQDMSLPMLYYGQYQAYFQQDKTVSTPHQLGEAAIWADAFQGTEAGYYENCSHFIALCLQKLDELNKLITKLAPSLPGCLSALQQAIARLGQVIDHLKTEKHNGTSVQAPTPAVPNPERPIADIEKENYIHLERLVAQLLQIDPHRPAHQVLRQAISWRALSLKDLMATIPGNEEDQVRVLKLLGLV